IQLLRKICIQFLKNCPLTQTRVSMMVDICKKRIQKNLDSNDRHDTMSHLDDFSMLIVKTFCMEQIEFPDGERGYAAFEKEFKRRGLTAYSYTEKLPFFHINLYLKHCCNSYVPRIKPKDVK